MAKLRVTFEVDTTQLFDALQKMKGDCGPIGERLAGALMTGNTSFRDRVGMDFYGIEFVGAAPADSSSAPLAKEKP